MNEYFLDEKIEKKRCNKFKIDKLYVIKGYAECAHKIALFLLMTNFKIFATSDRVILIFTLYSKL